VERAIRLLGRPQAESERLRAIFYNIVRLMNLRRGRKYVNRETIKECYSPETFLENIPDIEEKLNEIGLLTLQEFCFLFRVCTYQFIRSTSIAAILTSKRVSMVAKVEHLKRRRRVVDCLVEKRE
jgi:hypothetical protein